MIQNPSSDSPPGATGRGPDLEDLFERAHAGIFGNES